MDNRPLGLNIEMSIKVIIDKLGARLFIKIEISALVQIDLYDIENVETSLNSTGVNYAVGVLFLVTKWTDNENQNK